MDNVAQEKYMNSGNSDAIRKAICNGDHEKVLTILRNGYDLDWTDGKGQSFLYLAAENGRLAICKVLLAYGATLLPPKPQPSPLDGALSKKHANVAAFLLTKMPAVNVADPDNPYNDALRVACDEGYYEIVCSLIERGADVNTVCPWKSSPLHEACLRRNVKIVNVLLRHGANIDAINHQNRKPIEVAEIVECQEIVDLLEDVSIVKKELNAKYLFAETPLYLAALAGKYHTCYALLEQGAAVDPCKNGLFSPLTAAAGNGHLDLVKLLRKKGAQLVYNGDALSPLHVATSNGHTDVVCYLLEEGADPNACCNEDYPLIRASRKGYEDIVWHLLKKGANPDAKSTDGNTPLHLAALYGYQGIVRMLLGQRADANAVNDAGETALELAMVRRRDDIAATLTESGATRDKVRHSERIILTFKGPREESKQNKEKTKSKEIAAIASKPFRCLYPDQTPKATE